MTRTFHCRTQESFLTASDGVIPKSYDWGELWWNQFFVFLLQELFSIPGLRCGELEWVPKSQAKLELKKLVVGRAPSTSCEDLFGGSIEGLWPNIFMSKSQAEIAGGDLESLPVICPPIVEENTRKRNKNNLSINTRHWRKKINLLVNSRYRRINIIIIIVKLIPAVGESK